MWVTVDECWDDEDGIEDWSTIQMSNINRWSWWLVFLVPIKDDSKIANDRTQQQDNAKCSGTKQVKKHGSSCSMLLVFIQNLRPAPVIGTVDQARLLPWASDKSSVTVPRRDLYKLGGHARSYGEQRQCSSHFYRWCVVSIKPIWAAEMAWLCVSSLVAE